jgi:pimeloyl-ACP methyl ester carboxylesterase
LHVAAALPDRLDGVLCIDPLGAVGDGGEAAFEAEMFARTPEDVRQKAKELDEQALAGEGTIEAALESLRLVWPAYFADPGNAPPMPPTRMSLDAYALTWASLKQFLPEIEAALPGIDLPLGMLAGGRSPMPLAAATDTAARIPGSWVDVVPDAGHFPWHEQPGCVRAALQRLEG